MSNDILNSMTISASGMRAQGARIRVATENLANADTTSQTPGGDPYRRQTITFKNVLDKQIGADTVQVSRIAQDTKTPFVTTYAPDNPGADKTGYVKTPNVNSLTEIMDVREAQRSYEANLGMMDQSRSMIQRTVDMLK